MKQRYKSQFGESFEAYPPHTIRLKDEVWEQYLEIKKQFGKNHNYAIEQLILKYKK